MDKRDVVLITGANSGMGRVTALALARTGARVVMLCRDKTRGEEAFLDVRKKSGSDLVELALCDLGNLNEIKAFAETFKKNFSTLSVLINNAGVILPKRHLTKDGFELQFGVNHLGHFLLTNLLLETLLKSVHARIINVSSGAHKVGKIYFDDVNLTQNYAAFRAYAQSKLANVLFTYEMAKRLSHTSVTVNCLHPGAVATSMGVNRETGFGATIMTLLKPFFQSPENGAETAIYLATSPDVLSITGQYFYKKQVKATSKLSYDTEVAKKLWDLSVRMTGLETSLKLNYILPFSNEVIKIWAMPQN